MVKSQSTAEVRPCAIADAMDVIGERWSLLIVRELLWGNNRFSGIQAQTGAPRDVLSARLKSLVEAGILERRRYSERPPRDEYLLTDLGKSLEPILLAIQEWSLANGIRDPGLPPSVQKEHHGHQIDPVSRFTCRVCGEEIAQH